MVSVLRGICIALLVTIVTLLVGLAWTSMELAEINLSTLVDIGLVASCLVGGYYTGKNSGEWLLGGITGLGYVIVGTLLLALFLPISGSGFLQVLAEGGVLGGVGGAFGSGNMYSAKPQRKSFKSFGGRRWDRVSNSFYYPRFEKRERTLDDLDNLTAYDADWPESRRGRDIIKETEDGRETENSREAEKGEKEARPSYKWWEEELS